MSQFSNPVHRSAMVVAGEASGEMYAAELIDELQAKNVNTPLNFFGCGGDQMRQAGVETLVDIHKLAVLGPVEVMSHLWHLYSAMKALVLEAKKRSPCLAILVDFPDFNLRLARRLKSMGIPVVYFISPQVWAWRKGRVSQIKALVDHMLVILPFEKEFYSGFGVDVEFVGHPLVDRVKLGQPRADFLGKHGLKPEIPIISLMPGSRTKEIRYNLPFMLQSAQRVSARHDVQFILPFATADHRRLIQRIWSEETPRLPLKLIEGDTYDAVGHSELAVVSSGTATLEAALLGTPLITVFRISNLTWIIGQYLVEVPFYSLVNLIAGKRVVPELFQHDFTVETLTVEIEKYMGDPALRESVRMELSGVRTRLGAGGAIRRAAERVCLWL